MPTAIYNYNMRYFLLVCLFLASVVHAQAQGWSHCIAVAGHSAPNIVPERIFKALDTDALREDEVRISYIAHAMFLIEGGGATAVTDYTGFLGSRDLVPDIVTMNNAHNTHWTANPDPRIPHVLQGWPTADGPAQWWIKQDGMVVRNVTSDTRSAWGGGRRPNANSIFVFEVAGLCIGHLGHLHQELTDEQYARIGRLDVVMAPVDGGMTLDHGTMIRVLERLQARVIIPMHWFTDFGLRAFLTALDGTFAVDRRDAPSLRLSLFDLPPEPTVMVMRPSYLRD